MIGACLDPHMAHLSENEPVPDAAAKRELRIESLCVAGCPAEIKPLPPVIQDRR